MVLEEAGPADGTEDEGEIDGQKSNDDLVPVSLSNLIAEDVVIEVEFFTAPKEERDERREYHDSKDQLSFIQAISDSVAGFIVWGGLLIAACDVTTVPILIGSALVARGSLGGGLG